jgi:hypothetical protein
MHKGPTELSQGSPVAAPAAQMPVDEIMSVLQKPD